MLWAPRSPACRHRLSEVATAVALVVEIVGSLALIFGFGTRWAALALAFFALVTSFFFHNYCAVPAEQVMVQQMMFFKNMAVEGGGFLILAASGAGARRLAP
ncbi:MAG: DoxX family protein [Polaromonas sp.]|nr:DoxX family protein [Polaromonas sp.]